MPLNTRALVIAYGNLLGGNRSSTAPALTSTETINLANEIYDWLYLALTPRVAYHTHAGFTHADGITVVADSGLRLVNAADYMMTSNLTTHAELFSVHFEGLAASDPATIESTQLEYLDQHEFLERRAALGSDVAPRYVHWRRLSTTATTSVTAVGKWEILVAPAKSQASGAGHWYFSLVSRKQLTAPNTAIVSSPPLSGDSSAPDLLPHETYLFGRLLAYEIAYRTGRPKRARLIARNIPRYLLRSFNAARGIGEITVAA